MIDTIVEKAKGFLTDPVGTFQRSRTDEPGTVFTYFSVLLLVNAIFSAILAAAFIGTIPLFAGMKFGALLPVIVFFAVLVGGFIITLIFAAWVHLWVYIFGGRKGIMQTINAIIYGHTPRLLFGWIPFIGFIFTLWSLVLNIIGLRELQELSTLKAILVMAIAVIIPLMLIIIAAAYFFISSVTMTGLPPSQTMPSLLR